MYMYLEAYKVLENDFKKPQEIKGRSCIKILINALAILQNLAILISI